MMHAYNSVSLLFFVLNEGLDSYLLRRTTQTQFWGKADMSSNSDHIIYDSCHGNKKDVSHIPFMHLKRLKDLRPYIFLSFIVQSVSFFSHYILTYADFFLVPDKPSFTSSFEGSSSQPCMQLVIKKQYCSHDHPVIQGWSYRRQLLKSQKKERKRDAL